MVYQILFLVDICCDSGDILSGGNFMRSGSYDSRYAGESPLSVKLVRFI